MGAEMAEGMGRTELLFGRRTYENFYSFWPNQPEPNPFTEVLNNTQKYVASVTLTEPLPWVHSTLLTGDAADAVSELKGQEGMDLVVLGSGELVRSLMKRNLVDEFTLLIHPLILGSRTPSVPRWWFDRRTAADELGPDHHRGHIATYGALGEATT
jgi:dihydrofolate reductase